MPVFVRPARVMVIEDGGGVPGVLVALLVAAALAGPVVAKVLGWIATPVTVALWTAVGVAVAAAVALPWWVKRKRPVSAGGSFLDGPELPARAPVALPGGRRAIGVPKVIPGVVVASPGLRARKGGA